MVLENRRDKAIGYFSARMHCSQAVIAAFSEECGISEEQAFRLGSCFGSGMRKGQVCGACTGALMVLGLLYGQHHVGDQEGRELSDRVNDMMMDRFERANGSFICNDLLGCDISTPEGAKEAHERGLFMDFCPKMVGSAVDILEGIIQETRDGNAEMS
jgi:C_GCAxxG_C_C family probable redox protein